MKREEYRREADSLLYNEDIHYPVMLILRRI
jgi:hypothetical protein